MDGRIIFITGTSGAGKSTLKHLLKDDESASVKLHDFDEVGVPEGADHHWRIKTTRDWLNYADDNRKAGIHTLIIGQTSPEEVLELSNEMCISNIAYGFIEISEDLIRTRLTERNWDPDLIDANVGWAIVLKNQLKKWDDYVVYNGNSGDESELVEFFKNWISKLIS